MQILSNAKFVRGDKMQDSKKFNSQSLSTPAKKRRTISFFDACYLKSFWLNGWQYNRIINKKRIFEN